MAIFFQQGWKIDRRKKAENNIDMTLTAHDPSFLLFYTFPLSHLVERGDRPFITEALQKHVHLIKLVMPVPIVKIMIYIGQPNAFKHTLSLVL